MVSDDVIMFLSSLCLQRGGLITTIQHAGESTRKFFGDLSFRISIFSRSEFYQVEKISERVLLDAKNFETRSS